MRARCASDGLCGAGSCVPRDRERIARDDFVVDRDEPALDERLRTVAENCRCSVEMVDWRPAAERFDQLESARCCGARAKTLSRWMSDGRSRAIARRDACLRRLGRRVRRRAPPAARFESTTPSGTT